MADNPIKYADLLLPDDSITKAISQLENLSTTYEKMLAKIKEEAISLEVSIKKVNGATTEGQNTTKKAATDAEKLTKAQKDYEFAMSETAKQLQALKQQQAEQNAINKLTIKFNESAAGSYNKLSAEYSLNKITLNQMSAEERSATQAGRELETSTKAIYEEMKRLQEATGKNQLNVGNYRGSLEGMNVTVRELTAAQQKLDITTREGRNQYRALQTQIDQTKSSMQQLTATNGKMVTGLKTFASRLMGAFGLIGGVYLFAKALKDVYVRIKEFDDRMQNMVGIAGSTREEMRGVEEEIKRVAGTSVKTSNEVAQLAENLFTLGKTKEEVINMLEPVNNLAIGLETSSENAANLLGQTLNAFGKGSESAAYFADIIANMRTSTALDFERIKVSLGYLAPTAKTVGLTLGQTGAVIGVLADNGVEASRAGQLINSSFARLADRGLTLNDALVKISSSNNKVKTSSDLLGKRAFGLGIILADNQAKLKTLGDEFDNLSTGSLKKLTDEQLQSMGAKVKILDSTWEKFILDIDAGKGVISRSIKGVVSGLTTLIEKLDGLTRTDTQIISSRQEKIVRDVTGQLAGITDKEERRKILSEAILKIESDRLKTNEKVNNLAKQMPNVLSSTVQTFNRMIGLGGQFTSGIDLKLLKEDYEKDSDALGLAAKKLKSEFETLVQGSASGTANLSAEAQAVQDEITKATQSAQEKEIEAVREKYEDLINKAKKYGLDYKDLITVQNKEIEKIRKNYAKKEVDKQDQDRLDALRKANALEIEMQKSKNDLIIASDSSTLQEKTKALQDNAQLESDLLKVNAENELEDLKTKKEQGLINDKNYAAQKLLIEKQLAKDLLDVSNKLGTDKQKAAEKDLELSDKVYEDKKKVAKEDYDSQVKTIDDQTDLALSEIDLLKTTEAEKTRLKLKAEQDRLRAILKLNEEGNKQLSENEIAIIKNTIEVIGNEIKDPKNQSYDLYSLAGLNLSDEKKAAINDSVNFAIGQVNNFLQAKIDAAQKAVDAAQKETDAAKSNLDAEIQARQNGFASNVSLAQKELAAAKKNQNDAIKEQQKAQKAQAAIETLQQTSSLITASAKIWGTLGFPWAIPALAIMWGSFIGAKLQAAKLTKVTYGEGGMEFLEGGSHASGNDINIGTTKSGRPRRAEGGEALAIINKRQTAKYKNALPGIIDSLNKGVFEEKYGNAYSNDTMQTNEFTTIDLSKIENSVEDIRNQGQRKTYTDGKGNEVRIYKNLKQTILSNN